MPIQLAARFLIAATLAAVGGRALAAPKPNETILTLGESFTAPGGVIFTLRQIGAREMTRFELEVIDGKEKQVFKLYGRHGSVRWHAEGYAAGHVFALDTHPDLDVGGPKLTSEQRSQRHRQRRLTLTKSESVPAAEEVLKKTALSIASKKLEEMKCAGLGVSFSVANGTMPARNNPTRSTKRTCTIQVGLYTHVVFVRETPYVHRQPW